VQCWHLLDGCDGGHGGDVHSVYSGVYYRHRCEHGRHDLHSVRCGEILGGVERGIVFAVCGGSF
jgi:hypothetical protein